MNVYDRERALRARLNAFLIDKFGLPTNDYYSKLDRGALAGLKAVLGDINNIFTLRICLAFGTWLGRTFNLDATALAEINDSILRSPPNANGYDLAIEHPISVIAEVKCNVPINGGSIYGAAQRQGVLKDVNALMQGKTKARVDPSKRLKFLVLLDTPEVRAATRHLVKNMKVHRDAVLFAENGIKPDRTDKLYIVHVGSQ